MDHLYIVIAFIHLPINICDLHKFHFHITKQLSKVLMDMMMITTVQIYSNLRMKKKKYIYICTYLLLIKQKQDTQ